MNTFFFFCIFKYSVMSDTDYEQLKKKFEEGQVFGIPQYIGKINEYKEIENYVESQNFSPDDITILTKSPSPPSSSTSNILDEVKNIDLDLDFSFGKLKKNYFGDLKRNKNTYKNMDGIFDQIIFMAYYYNSDVYKKFNNGNIVDPKIQKWSDLINRFSYSIMHNDLDIEFIQAINNIKDKIEDTYNSIIKKIKNKFAEDGVKYSEDTLISTIQNYKTTPVATSAGAGAINVSMESIPIIPDNKSFIGLELSGIVQKATDAAKKVDEEKRVEINKKKKNEENCKKIKEVNLDTLSTLDLELKQWITDNKTSGCVIEKQENLKKEWKNTFGDDFIVDLSNVDNLIEQYNKKKKNPGGRSC